MQHKFLTFGFLAFVVFFTVEMKGSQVSVDVCQFYFGVFEFFFKTMFAHCLTFF